jgi:hypothetical protein
MLMLALTYHQVMPSFLDFIFPFGRQLYPQDFHFSGFRIENRLSPLEIGLSLPELGRSGRGYRLCYSLRSVERSTSQKDWPWSIRQTSIYHEFNIDSGHSAWVIVKGSELMKTRVMSATESSEPSELTTFGTTDRAFAASLATQLIFCDWSAENWRWYINFLEEALQKTTRRILSTPVDAPLSPTFERPSRSTTQPTLSEPGTKSWISILRRAAIPASRLPTSPPSNNQSLQPAGCPLQPPEPPRGRKGQEMQSDQQEFSFNDLQRIQFIEEKANEARLILKVNEKVIDELKLHYRSSLDSEYCPEVMSRNCKLDFAKFSKRVISIQNDLRVQQSRAESLLRLLADRKSLVSRCL